MVQLALQEEYVASTRFLQMISTILMLCVMIRAKGTVLMKRGQSSAVMVDMA